MRNSFTRFAYIKTILSFIFRPVVQQTPPPPVPRPVDNPMIVGDIDEKRLLYFGPSDFRPEDPYKRPVDRTAGSLLPWQVGFIPIPR